MSSNQIPAPDRLSAEVQLKTQGVAELATVRDQLTKEGFTINVVGPVSFSIEGPRSLFQKYFSKLDTGGHERLPLDSDEPLRLDKLPEPTKQLVSRIVFTRPAFGLGAG
jgi:hypothetical protein